MPSFTGYYNICLNVGNTGTVEAQYTLTKLQYIGNAIDLFNAIFYSLCFLGVAFIIILVVKYKPLTYSEHQILIVSFLASSCLLFTILGPMAVYFYVKPLQIPIDALLV